MFATKFARPETVKEKNNGKKKVETAGYIPAITQIENLINAGMRLNQYRDEMYDFGAAEEVDDSFSDPTRNPNFDMADASMLAKEVEMNLRAQKEEAEREKKKKVTEVTNETEVTEKAPE